MTSKETTGMILAAGAAGVAVTLLGGEPGIGKSTVLRRLLAELELTDADTAVCDGSGTLGADGLLAMLRSRLQLSGPAPRSLWGPRLLQDVLAQCSE